MLSVLGGYPPWVTALIAVAAASMGITTSAGEPSSGTLAILIAQSAPLVVGVVGAGAAWSAARARRLGLLDTSTARRVGMSALVISAFTAVGLIAVAAGTVAAGTVAAMRALPSAPGPDLTVLAPYPAALASAAATGMLLGMTINRLLAAFASLVGWFLALLSHHLSSESPWTSKYRGLDDCCTTSQAIDPGIMWGVVLSYLAVGVVISAGLVVACQVLPRQGQASALPMLGPGEPFTMTKRQWVSTTTVVVAGVTGAITLTSAASAIPPRGVDGFMSVRVPVVCTTSESTSSPTTVCVRSDQSGDLDRVHAVADQVITGIETRYGVRGPTLFTHAHNINAADGERTFDSAMDLQDVELAERLGAASFPKLPARCLGKDTTLTPREALSMTQAQELGTSWWRTKAVAEVLADPDLTPAEALHAAEMPSGLDHSALIPPGLNYLWTMAPSAAGEWINQATDAVVHCDPSALPTNVPLY